MQVDTCQADFLKRKNDIKNIPGGHLPGRQNTEPERELSGGAQGTQGNKNKNGSNTIILLSYLHVAEVEFVHAVTAGGSVKFLPAV